MNRSKVWKRRGRYKKFLHPGAKFEVPKSTVSRHRLADVAITQPDEDLAGDSSEASRDSTTAREPYGDGPSDSSEASHDNTLNSIHGHLKLLENHMEMGIATRVRHPVTARLLENHMEMGIATRVRHPVTARLLENHMEMGIATRVRHPVTARLLENHMEMGIATRVRHPMTARLHENHMKMCLATRVRHPVTARGTAIWPVQLLINELPPEQRMNKLVLAALWFGKEKPDMELFQGPFVDALNKLGEDGFLLEHEGKQKERERPDVGRAHHLSDLEALQHSDFQREFLQSFLIAGSGPMIPERPPALANVNVAKCKELDSAFFTHWGFDQCPQSHHQ
ncbi:hypothetical protein MTO96_005112 [Rhipicephalus appendiculatus]